MISTTGNKTIKLKVLYAITSIIDFVKSRRSFGTNESKTFKEINPGMKKMRNEEKLSGSHISKKCSYIFL